MLGNSVDLGKMIVEGSLVLSVILFLGMFAFACLSGGIPSRWARRITVAAFAVFFGGVLSGTVISDHGRAALRSSFETACVANGGDTVEHTLDGTYQCWDVPGGKRVFFDFET